MPSMRTCIGACSLLLVASVNAQGACTFYPDYGPVQAVLSLPQQIVVPNTGPIGSTLYSIHVPGNSTSLTCDPGQTLSSGWVAAQVDSGVGEGVYATHLPGVGMRVTQRVLPDEIMTWPRSTRDLSDNSSHSPSSNYEFSLIKTGPITNGELILPGQLVMRQYGGLVSNTLIYAGGAVEIIDEKPTCAVDPGSRQVFVPMGEPHVRDFTGVGHPGGRPVDFTLRLNCQGGSVGRLNVHLTLTDATAPANRSAVLTLKAEATARGVGLQVRRPDGTPVHYGAPSEEVGNPNQWLVGSVAQGVPVFSIPLTAHYIQTEPRVVPGSVGARAIFTLAYD